MIFFATGPDLQILFKIVEGKGKLQFIQAGRFDTVQQPIILDAQDIPDLGIASANSSSLCRRFLVSERGLPIVARQLSSDPPFAFDQLENPKTVMFSPGGLWKDEILIKGSVGTSSADPDSSTLLSTFRAAFKSAFANTRGVYVGKEAADLLRQGKRLTGAEQSPAEYDLAF